MILKTEEITLSKEENKIQNNTFAVIKTSYDMHRKKYTGKSKEIHTAVTVAVLDGCGSLV